MRKRLLIAVAITLVLVIAGILLAYPMWIRHRADRLVEEGGCRGDRVPTADFYEALRLEERVDAFPGFGPSDPVAAEAAFCAGSLMQMCNLAEDAQRKGEDPAKRCAPWAEFASWYRGLFGEIGDACAACAPTFGR